MFPFPLKHTEKLEEFITVEEGWKIPRIQVDYTSETRDIAWNRQVISALHRDFIIHGMKKLHQSSAGQPIYHAVTNHTPLWFEKEMRSCFEAAKSGPNQHFIGKLKTNPAMDKYMINTHSGKHYTPEYNRHYAETLFSVTEKILDN